MQLMVSLALMLVGKANAQITIDNQTSCDIKLNYESFVGSPPGCSVCGWGTTTAFSGIPLSVGCSSDVCVSILSVGGNNITWYNHANSAGICHGAGGVPWITGMSSTGECTGGWTASWNTAGTVLTIQ